MIYFSENRQYIALVQKMIRIEEQRDAYLDDLLAYREWFLMNEDKLKEITITAPPYTKRNDEQLLKVLHAKYCECEGGENA